MYIRKFYWHTLSCHALISKQALSFINMKENQAISTVCNVKANKEKQKLLETCTGPTIP